MFEHLPLSSTSLRLSFFYENFQHWETPTPDGELRLPWGDTAVPLISKGDVGGVVCGLFKAGPRVWGGKVFGAAGDLLTGTQIANIWTSAAGAKAIKYHPVSPEDYILAGADKPFVLQVTEMHRCHEFCVQPRNVSTFFLQVSLLHFGLKVFRRVPEAV